MRPSSFISETFLNIFGWLLSEIWCIIVMHHSHPDESCYMSFMFLFHFHPLHVIHVPVSFSPISIKQLLCMKLMHAPHDYQAPPPPPPPPILNIKRFWKMSQYLLVKSLNGDTVRFVSFIEAYYWLCLFNKPQRFDSVKLLFTAMNSYLWRCEYL